MDSYGIRSEYVFADFATGLIILYSIWIATCDGGGVRLCRLIAGTPASSLGPRSFELAGLRNHSKKKGNCKITCCRLLEPPLPQSLRCHEDPKTQGPQRSTSCGFVSWCLVANASQHTITPVPRNSAELPKAVE